MRWAGTLAHLPTAFGKVKMRVTLLGQAAFKRGLNSSSLLLNALNSTFTNSEPAASVTPDDLALVYNRKSNLEQAGSAKYVILDSMTLRFERIWRSSRAMRYALK